MRNLTYLILLLLLLPSVIAATTIEIAPLSDRIAFGEKASFRVTITNQRDEAQTYDVSSPGTGILWDVKTQPLRDSSVYIGAHQSKDVIVTVEPIEKFQPGVYIVNLDVTSTAGERTEKTLKVFMGPSEPKEYLPSLRVTIDMNDRIDPREAQSVKLLIENLNPLQISPLVIEMSSEVPELNLQQTIDLPPGPGQARSVEFSFKMSDAQQPKEYYMFFQFKREDEVIKVVDKRIEVIPITDPFEQITSEEKKFLKRIQRLAIRNTGNVKNTQTITTPAAITQRIFGVIEPAARVEKRNEQPVFAWDFELAPNETATVTMTKSYRIPAAIVLLVIICGILYRVYRHPLVLRKVASKVEVHEGAVAGLKVTIIVKNITNKLLKDVEIHDQLPGITDFEHGVEMGSLKPYSVHKQGNHTLVKWKLSELEGKEERLISYKVKSHLKIVGTVQLPRAKALVSTARGRKRVSYSNIYRITTGE